MPANRENDDSTEGKIKTAARKVFQQKGFAAARTRDIAEEPGINLALLNYYFRSKGKLFDLIMMEENKADLILEIPSNFERDLVREKKEDLFLAINAINGTKASVGSVYLSLIINTFNQDIRQEWIPANQASTPQIEVASINWFNPYLDYQLFMVP
ncbi:helix-turn-helix domain-containing protein [Echinicola jeungdonensis]|uniref:TetR/AcrR family transcriptional regulator n=1 Tax=Echinicola jeungdonensis TaxID=709343 RepID=A0ABV5J9F1_9BACT|nr:TetR/AcrR family transcriptional regulator [Echinicola jeungdonensis]MDN3670454.1 helix-turn-helix domain-containing protein [Echinicola jeungdonensis]